jgi:putative addiction module component (TIGR02574 family)
MLTIFEWIVSATTMTTITALHVETPLFGSDRTNSLQGWRRYYKQVIRSIVRACSAELAARWFAHYNVRVADYSATDEQNLLIRTRKVRDMSQAAEELKVELAKLPIPERAELAQFLIHSLEDGWDVETEAAWDAELARRATEIKKGDAKGESAQIVFDTLRKKYS